MLCCLQLVTRLNLQSKDTGRVNYRLRGSIAAVPIDVDLESEFELNLLTGRVLKHKWDCYNASCLGPTAGLPASCD